MGISLNWFNYNLPSVRVAGAHQHACASYLHSACFCDGVQIPQAGLELATAVAEVDLELLITLCLPLLCRNSTDMGPCFSYTCSRFKSRTQSVLLADVLLAPLHTVNLSYKCLLDRCSRSRTVGTGGACLQTPFHATTCTGTSRTFSVVVA